MFKVVPNGFVPSLDKGYLIAFTQLPDGASLDRTEAVVRTMADIGHQVPGVRAAVEFPGLSISGFTNSTNAGIVFFGLDSFDKRRTPELSADAIAAQLNQRMAGIKDAFVLVVPPAPVRGLGTIGGFKLMVEDRSNVGFDKLNDALKVLQARAAQDQRAAAVRGHRPRQGQAAGRAAAEHLPDPADQPRFAVRQRLQPVWPHVPGAGPGRQAVPLARRGHRAVEGP
jgi:multidrug efflux pump